MKSTYEGNEFRVNCYSLINYKNTNIHYGIFDNNSTNCNIYAIYTQNL